MRVYVEMLSGYSYPKLFEFFCDRYHLSCEVSWNLLLKIQNAEKEGLSVRAFLYKEFEKILK